MDCSDMEVGDIKDPVLNSKNYALYEKAREKQDEISAILDKFKKRNFNAYPLVGSQTKFDPFINVM